MFFSWVIILMARIFRPWYHYRFSFRSSHLIQNLNGISTSHSPPPLHSPVLLRGDAKKKDLCSHFVNNTERALLIPHLNLLIFPYFLFDDFMILAFSLIYPEKAEGVYVELEESCWQWLYPFYFIFYFFLSFRERGLSWVVFVYRVPGASEECCSINILETNFVLFLELRYDFGREKSSEVISSCLSSHRKWTQP